MAIDILPNPFSNVSTVGYINTSSRSQDIRAITQPNGQDGYLLVHVFNLPGAVASVQYAGRLLTRLDTSRTYQPAGVPGLLINPQVEISMWGLKNPPTGINYLQINYLPLHLISFTAGFIAFPMVGVQDVNNFVFVPMNTYGSTFLTGVMPKISPQSSLAISSYIVAQSTSLSVSIPACGYSNQNTSNNKFPYPGQYLGTGIYGIYADKLSPGSSVDVIIQNNASSSIGMYVAEILAAPTAAHKTIWL